jgi:hypothetical protein
MESMPIRLTVPCFVVSNVAAASGGVVAESLRLLSNHTDVFAAPLTLTSPGNTTRTFTSLSQVSHAMV